MKLRFEFDKSIQKEMIGQQYFSNNFSINLNDSICITLQFKFLRKSYTHTHTHTHTLTHTHTHTHTHTLIKTKIGS